MSVLLRVIAAAAGADASWRRPSQAAMDAAQKQEIEPIVHDYLLANPEVLERGVQGAAGQARPGERRRSRPRRSRRARTSSTIRRTRWCSAIPRARSRWSSSSTTIAPIAGAPSPT